MGWMRHAVATVVKRIFAAGGYEIVRREARNGPLLPDLLPMVIEHYVAAFGPGAVLQIGAHDGVMDDPVHASILRWKLPALLVEPMPDFFARLQANYASQSGVAFENVAVSTSRGEATLYRLANDRALPAWAHGMASFNRQVILEHKDWPELRNLDLEKLIVNVRVPVLTVADLLAKHPALGPILVLQIDTEGHDYQVLRSAVAAGCLPPIINYEHAHLSYDDSVAARELLTQHGYGFHTDENNTLAVKRL